MQKIGGKFIPTETGLVVTDLLVKNFEEIFDPAVHGAAGRRAGRDRRRQREVDRRAGRASTKSLRRTSATLKSTWRT